jgi:hypothetical protein
LIYFCVLQDIKKYVLMKRILQHLTVTIILIFALSVRDGISQSNFDSTDCSDLAWATYYLAGGDDYQKMYDSARYVIEHCYMYNSFPPIHIWGFFGEATSGVQYLSSDPNRWPPYRDWLKKVLYYNMDTSYYCEDVVAISSSMQYFNAERGYDMNGALAILKFLMDSNRCSSFFTDSFNNIWKNTRKAQLNTWRDTSRDPAHNPLDTTLPTLEDLDLQILRGPQYAAVKNAFTPSTNTKLEYLTVSDNPFKNETTLRFGLADAEYMKLEIYDMLRNKIYSDSQLFTGGDEEWRIEGKGILHGALFARLATMGGEVKTVKLMHE